MGEFKEYSVEIKFATYTTISRQDVARKVCEFFDDHPLPDDMCSSDMTLHPVMGSPETYFTKVEQRHGGVKWDHFESVTFSGLMKNGWEHNKFIDFWLELTKFLQTELHTGNIPPEINIRFGQKECPFRSTLRRLLCRQIIV